MVSSSQLQLLRQRAPGGEDDEPSLEEHHNPSGRPPLCNSSSEAVLRPPRSAPASQRPSPPGSALPSRRGSPMWRRPSSAFGTTTMTRSQSATLYHGKDMPQTTLGSFGPGSYDVRCSRTGTPRGRAKGGTPIFTGATGMQRETASKRYEGKEWEATKRGKFGPGGYEPRTSNRGSPLWRRPSSAFGKTTMTRPQSATLYHGKDMPQTTLGSFGPGSYDVRCSRTGTPRDRAKGGTPIFTSATGMQRESNPHEHARGVSRAPSGT